MAAVFGGSPLPAQDSAASSVQADELEAQEANLFRQSIVRLEPMDYTGLDYGLGSVLRNYYKQNFTSAENWEQFQSIRFEGTSSSPTARSTLLLSRKSPTTARWSSLPPTEGVSLWPTTAPKPGSSIPCKVAAITRSPSAGL